jgi:hypothetical protein
MCGAGSVTFSLLAYKNWNGSTFPDVMSWAPLSFSFLCVGIAYWIVMVYRAPTDVAVELREEALVLTGIAGFIPLRELRAMVGEAIQLTDDGAGIFVGPALIVEVQDLSRFLQMTEAQSALFPFHYRDRIQFLLGKHVSEEQARAFVDIVSRRMVSPS